MSDSVGKISLDLEVQSDLQGQISRVSSLISKNMSASLNAGTKSMFENMKANLNNSTKVLNNNLANSIGKMKSNLTNSFKAMFSALKNIKMPSISFPKATNAVMPKVADASAVNKTRGSPVNSEALKTEIDNTATSLDVVNRKIEQQQAKLLQLKESYATTFNEARKNKIEEQILKTEASINKLIGQSDKLGFKLSDLDAKFASLGAESKATGNKIGLFNSVANSADVINKKLNNSVKSVGNGMNKASNNSRSFSSGLSMVTRQFFTWMVILPIVMKGLTAMATGLYNNLMTNAEFANSLAQIKTNLMVAFTPIYNAILPAINTLMSALSVATQYIASFISAIFGKTYQQSYQATQGLIDAKVAMGAYGDSASKAAKQAKEAQGSLAGFDEINQLNMNNSADTGDTGSSGGGASKVPTLVTPSLDTSAVDSSMKVLVDKIKSYFGTFDFSNLINAFDRVKNAAMPIVDNIGQGLKWFFDNVLDPLAHWTIEDLLPAFLNLLAGALKILNPLLESFGRVFIVIWDTCLQPIATWTGGVIIGVLNELANALSNIGNWMGSNASVVDTITQSIIGFFVAWKVTELLAFIQTSGGVIGALTNIASAIWVCTGAKIADKIESMALTALYAKDFIISLASGTAELLKQAAQWTINTGLKLADAIATGVMTAATVAWNIVCGIATIATTALGVAFTFLTSPIGLVILAIAAVIAIGVLLYTHWDELKAKCIEVWDWIQAKFQAFDTFLTSIFETDWTNSFGAFGNILNAFFANVSNIWDAIKQIFSGIIDFVAGVFTGDWSRAWNGVKDIFSGIFNGLGAILKAPLNGVIGLINMAIDGINSISIDIPDWVPEWAGGGSTFGVDIPKIPYLAHGGVIDSPTLAMVGEAGKEAVVPLENNTGGLDLVANKLLERMPQGNGSNDSGDLILMIDSSVIGKVALKELRKMQRQGNITLIPT